MTNKITKQELGEDLWEDILEDYVGFIQDDHRRYGTRYVTVHYVIDSSVTDNSDLWGDWESETIIWSDEFGFDCDPETLYRIELVETVVKKWKRVK